MCHKTISLSLAGKSALSRHVEGEKHKQNMGKRKNFFKPQVGKIDAAKSTIDLVDIDETGGQQTLEKCLSNNDVTKAEIILKVHPVFGLKALE